jgi:polyhydroxyalkanoate synthesis regulator phasin
MEAILQPAQTQQVGPTLQQTQTQQTPQKLIVKVPKVSVYTKRSSSEALGTSSQQTAPKKMKITQSPQIVDLEEEEPKEQVSMDMVESGTNNEEVGKGSMLQSEGSSRTFSSKKHIFDKAPGAVYQSKEDLAKQYVEKGNLAMSEIRELIPEVENISQHKSSLFTVRDIEKKTLNIAVADEDKVSEIKLHYENISAPDKVKFHRNTSDMLYSDYLGLSLKNSRLSTHALKLEGTVEARESIQQSLEDSSQEIRI